MTTLDAPRLARGAARGIGAVAIWAAWMVVARLGVTTSLTALDVTAIRFGVAGLILLPVLWRRGFARDRLGWLGLVALALGGGAPTVLLASYGVWFAPAADGGALFPGVMPLFGSLLAVLVLKETFATTRRIGFALILAGAVGLIGVAGLTAGGWRTVGQLMFLGAAILWASYTVAMRRAQLDGLHAAAIGAVISLVVYLPIYVGLTGTALLAAPWPDIALQAIVQGVLTVVVSQYLYGQAVTILGASRAASFAALAPAMAAMMAIPLLGEWPAAADWLVIAVISAGVYLAGGGPLPGRATPAAAPASSGSAASRPRG
ncbi:MAG: DMT family transporter [Proteobacteria bacterium]|nr:DMT family transporter [Pseudomonadota bacterium]